MPPDEEPEPDEPLMPPDDELEPGEPLIPPRVPELPMPSSLWLPRSVRLPNELLPELPDFPDRP